MLELERRFAKTSVDLITSLGDVLEEILDPKNPWKFMCVVWGIHLKRSHVTGLPATGWSSQQHRESDSGAGRNKSLRLQKAR